VAGVNSSIGFAVNNSGTVAIPVAAGLNVGGNYTQTDGTTAVDGTLTASNTVFLDGGVLKGAGTINANVVNAAEVDPGDSPGILTINGNYTQTSDGTLVIEVGGLTVGTQYDRLVIHGTASLDGTLTVKLINGFQPNSGDAFVIMTFNSGSGTFAAINGDGSAFTPSYDPGDVTLVAN
jgi:hypothetical protein